MPSALVAPLSGMMADRFNRKRIMIVGGLLGAGVHAAMAESQRPLALIVVGSVAAASSAGAAGWPGAGRERGWDASRARDLTLPLGPGRA